MKSNIDEEEKIGKMEEIDGKEGRLLILTNNRKSRLYEMEMHVQNKWNKKKEVYFTIEHYMDGSTMKAGIYLSYEDAVAVAHYILGMKEEE